MENFCLMVFEDIFKNACVLENQVHEKIMKLVTSQKVPSSLTKIRFNKQSYKKFLGILAETSYYNPGKYPPNSYGEDVLVEYDENEENEKKKSVASGIESKTTPSSKLNPVVTQ